MHVPNLITVEFLLFIKSQFIINVQNTHLNQGMQVHILSLTVMPLQRS